MKARMTELKARYWDALSAEQQRTLSWGGWILAPLLAYGLLWQPAHDAVAKLQPVLSRLRAQAMQMQTQATEAQSLRRRAQPAVLEGDKMKSAVEAMAAKEGWRAPGFSVELAEQNNVRVVAERLMFVQWLRWLNDLEQVHHIRVDTVTVSALPESGMVRVSATLTNGAEQ
ncbi:MAG TPA: type II secretion system protein GspM [Sideroxyarcus sp.]|nr:type II secretion system protein GspM [Sideroxyarcus sp.]